MSIERYINRPDNSKDTLTGEFWSKVRKSFDSYDYTMLDCEKTVDVLIKRNHIHLINLMSECFSLGQKEAYDHAWIVQQREFNALLHKLEDEECDEGLRIARNWMLNNGIELEK